MGGQPALGLLLRKSWQHWPAYAFLRSSLARAAVHLIDADIVGYGILMPEIRLSKLLRKLRPFVDAGLKKQLVVAVGGRRPPFKRDRGTPVCDGDTASTYHALFACAKALRADGFQVILAESECDWRVVEFQRAMEGRGCPSIVYSRDYDYVNHMCPYLASLMSGQCGLTVQILDLKAAAHNLGLGGLGLAAFPILGALIPNSDWGSALKGVGPVAVLEIMQVLQQRLASPQQGSCAPPRLTPDLILDTALQQEYVGIHDSQTDRAAAVQTLAQCLIIFGRGPVVKVGLDFDADRLQIALGFSRSARIGSLHLDDSVCAEVTTRMEGQMVDAFDGVTPGHYISYVQGRVDPDGRQVLECEAPQGDIVSLVMYELETVVRDGPCVICRATDSRKWYPDFMDWAAPICSPCYTSIRYRLNHGDYTTVLAAVESWEHDIARRRALEARQWTAGQPCSLCNGDTGTDRRNLPAEVADHCADVGLDVGPLCASCWRAIKRWGSMARDAGQEENRKMVAGAQPLELEALTVEYSCMKVGRLTMQRGERTAVQEGAAG